MGEAQSVQRGSAAVYDPSYISPSRKGTTSSSLSSGTGSTPSPKRGDVRIAAKQGDIRQFYKLSRELGKGAFGCVWLASNLGPDEATYFAVKAVPKMSAELDAAISSGGTTAEKLRAAKRRGVAQVKQEIDTLTKLRHENIVSLSDTCETDTDIYIVLGFCAGGELEKYLIQSGILTEQIVAAVMRQLFEALRYCHDQRVCHRDVKPDNMLLATQDAIEHNVLKLADFGLACTFKPGEGIRGEVVGTAWYLAPQVIHGRYDNKCDLWSSGVTMYKLLCGYPPFLADREEAQFDIIRKGNFSFIPDDWQDISEDARSLIRLLIKMDPAERHSAQQALGDRWIKTSAASASNVQLAASLAHMREVQRSQARRAAVARVFERAGGGQAAQDWLETLLPFCGSCCQNENQHQFITVETVHTDQPARPVY